MTLFYRHSQLQAAAFTPLVTNQHIARVYPAEYPWAVRLSLSGSLLPGLGKICGHIIHSSYVHVCDEVSRKRFNAENLDI